MEARGYRLCFIVAVTEVAEVRGGCVDGIWRRRDAEAMGQGGGPAAARNAALGRRAARPLFAELAATERKHGAAHKYKHPTLRNVAGGALHIGCRAKPPSNCARSRPHGSVPAPF